MQEQITHQAAEAAAVATGKVSYLTGIGMMVVGGLTLQEWFMFVGALTTLGTFLVNWYYKHKQLAVAIQESEQRLKHHKQAQDNANRPSKT